MIRFDIRTCGQVIVADERYCYVFNRNGGYILSESKTEQPIVGYMDLHSRRGFMDSPRWKMVGYTADELIMIDGGENAYHIPRNDLNFLKGDALHRWAVAKMDNVPRLGLIHPVSIKGKEPGAYLESYDCFRSRMFLRDRNSGYGRADEWPEGRTAIVRDSAAEREEAPDKCKRTRVKLGDSEYEFFPGQRISDVSFSTDQLRLYMLYQRGFVLIMDVV